MPTRLYRLGLSVIATLCFLLVCLILVNKGLPQYSFAGADNLQSFKTMFISILLEAIPFILLGVVLSSLLQVFVSEQTISRLVPANPILGILFACVLGIIFPMCECGMIPVVRRLILKGMPVYIAVVFILTGPIINPIVYASTYLAFRSRLEMVYSRMGLAFVVAFVIGLFLYRYVKKNPLRLSRVNDIESHAHDEHHGTHHDHLRKTQMQHDHYAHQDHGHTHGGKVATFFVHASDEFFEMGKYLIFGSLITAGIQTFLDRGQLLGIGQGPVSSHIFMMGFAYVLSLCSTSDAFVASSFVNTFTAGSLLTFLVFGPMLDFKSTLMLLSIFKTRFVFLLAILICITVLSGSLLFERLFIT
jgi:uncharacterized membrane protein YraQ (UPF0718 family)